MKGSCYVADSVAGQPLYLGHFDEVILARCHLRRVSSRLRVVACQHEFVSACKNLLICAVGFHFPSVPFSFAHLLSIG